MPIGVPSPDENSEGGPGRGLGGWHQPMEAPSPWRVALSEPPEALGILPAPLHPPLEVTAALGSGQAAPQEC